MDMVDLRNIGPGEANLGLHGLPVDIECGEVAKSGSEDGDVVGSELNGFRSHGELGGLWAASKEGDGVVC